MKEQIIKRTIQYTEPLTKPQKASLLFYLLGWDGASAVMPYLTSSEQKKLQKKIQILLILYIRNYMIES